MKVLSSQMHGIKGITHIWNCILVRRGEYIPQHIDRGLWLDGNACFQPQRVDVLDQFCRARFLIGRGFGRLGCRRRYGCLVVEAIQIATCLFEVGDPFMWLSSRLAVDLLESHWCIADVQLQSLLH